MHRCTCRAPCVAGTQVQFFSHQIWYWCPMHCMAVYFTSLLTLLIGEVLLCGVPGILTLLVLPDICWPTPCVAFTLNIIVFVAASFTEIHLAIRAMSSCVGLNCFTTSITSFDDWWHLGWHTLRSSRITTIVQSTCTTWAAMDYRGAFVNTSE